MRFLILAVVLITACAAAAVGGDKCRWGPPYWCSSIQKASSCNAFTHCLQTVWERQLIDVQQTDVCLSSQELVETARRVRSVDGEIQTPLVTSLCNPAEDEATKERCHDTVSRFLPQVMSLLESSMEPSSVAVLLGLCQLYDDEPAVEIEHNVDDPAVLCQDCHMFLSDLRKLLNRPGTEEALATGIQNGVCQRFGNLEVWCKVVVEVGVPKLFKFLEENDGAGMLCGLSSLCPESEDRKLKSHFWSDIISQLFSDVEVDTDEEVICHDCEKVLTSVLAFDKESPTRMSVEHAIAHLCSLTSLNEETCRLLSEGFSRIPEDLLRTASRHVDVPNMCQSMIGCTGSEPEDSHPLASSALLVPPVSVIEDQTPQSPECTECLRLFDNVRQVFTTEETVTQATAQIKQSLCQQLGTLEEQCNRMAELFLPVMAEWITTKESPRWMCSHLNVCPNPTNFKTPDFIKLFGTIWQRDRLAELGSFECEVCHVLVEEALAVDRDPDVQKAVVNFFNGICDKLGQEATECKALVAQYAPDLFELLANELDPTVMCEVLMNCTKPEQQMTEEEEPVAQILPETVLIGQESSQSEAGSENESELQRQGQVTKKAKKAVQKAEESFECELCHVVMEKVDAAIAANSTEEELNKVLGEVCRLLPSSDTEPCEQLVDTYSPTIVQLLLQQLDPLLICRELQLCQETLPQVVEEVAEEEEEPEEDEMTADVLEEEGEEEKKEVPRETIECELCELVMDSLDKVVSQNRTEATVQKALDEVCEMIPEGLQSQCLSLVDLYAGVVMDLVLQELRPRQVCVFLRLCLQENTDLRKAVKVALPEVKDTPTQNTEDANSSHNKKQTSGVSDGEACALCQTLASLIGEALKQQATQDEVEKLLDDICTLFPENLKASCDTIVKQFTPLILQLLAEEDNPLVVCQSLKLCSKEAQQGRMEIGPVEKAGRMKSMAVGVDACTYGPGFWCASMDNARRCGMVQECVEKYGMKP